MSRILLPAILCLSLTVFSGCSNSSDPLNRQAVSGTVTLDGEDLDEGAITFAPNSATAGNATATGAVITEGKFQIPKESGLAPGEYRVSITSPESHSDRTGDDLMNNPGPPSRDRVAKKYNLNSELKASVQSGEPNKFDFDVTSK